MEAKGRLKNIINTNNQINGQPTIIKGKGWFSGADTRAEAAKEYQRIISEYGQNRVYSNYRIPETAKIPTAEKEPTPEIIKPDKPRITLPLLKSHQKLLNRPQ